MSTGSPRGPGAVRPPLGAPQGARLVLDERDMEVLQSVIAGEKPGPSRVAAGRGLGEGSGEGSGTTVEPFQPARVIALPSCFQVITDP